MLINNSLIPYHLPGSLQYFVYYRWDYIVGVMATFIFTALFHFSLILGLFGKDRYIGLKIVIGFLMLVVAAFLVLFTLVAIFNKLWGL